VDHGRATRINRTGKILLQICLIIFLLKEATLSAAPSVAPFPSHSVTMHHSDLIKTLDELGIPPNLIDEKLNQTKCVIVHPVFAKSVCARPVCASHVCSTPICGQPCATDKLNPEQKQETLVPKIKVKPEEISKPQLSPEIGDGPPKILPEDRILEGKTPTLDPNPTTNPEPSPEPSLEPRSEPSSELIPEPLLLPSPQILPQLSPEILPQNTPQRFPPQPVQPFMPQPIPQPIAQTIPQSVSPQVPQPVQQFMPQPIPQPIAQTIPQSVSPQVPQPTQQFMPQPIPQRFPPQLPQPVQQFMPQPMPQRFPSQVPQPTQQFMPQPIPQRFPSQVPQPSQQFMPQPIPQRFPSQVPQPPQQFMPQPIPQRFPQAMPQAVPRPMTAPFAPQLAPRPNSLPRGLAAPLTQPRAMPTTRPARAIAGGNPSTPSRPSAIGGPSIPPRAALKNRKGLPVITKSLTTKPDALQPAAYVQRDLPEVLAPPTTARTPQEAEEFIKKLVRTSGNFDLREPRVKMAKADVPTPIKPRPYGSFPTSSPFYLPENPPEAPAPTSLKITEYLKKRPPIREPEEMITEDLSIKDAKEQ